ncbi:hypothetical protein X979_5913 [Burkholderia pseudomallei MSHR7527]|nr:hypothetical protein X979_5913 [Burkholderia pseudomallei MSHR7527]
MRNSTEPVDKQSCGYVTHHNIQKITQYRLHLHLGSELAYKCRQLRLQLPTYLSTLNWHRHLRAA